MPASALAKEELGTVLGSTVSANHIVAGAYCTLFALVLPGGFYVLRAKFAQDAPSALDDCHVG